MRTPLARFFLPVTFALLGVLPACSIQKIAKSATEGSAQAIEEREKKGSSPVANLVSGTIADEDVKKGVGDLAGSTLQDAKVKQGVRELASEGAAGVTPQLAPAVRTIIQGSLSGGAAAVQAPMGKEQLDEITRAVTLSASRSIAEAMSSEEPGSLRPVMRDMAREVSREAAMGARDALKDFDPMANPAQRDMVTRMGLALGEGMGPGMVYGVAHSYNIMAVMIVMSASMALLASIAFYALWKQNRATSEALRLLAERLGASLPQPAPAQPPPSRRLSIPPSVRPQTA